MTEPLLQPAYDTMGHGYQSVRQPDTRLEKTIAAALGDATTVVNVGAGAGSYEPADRWILAVEPSSVMITQRHRSAAPALQTSVENLPLADKSVDAALAVLTVQHWENLELGLRQLVRVARKRIVLVTMDVQELAKLWILADYLPELVDQHTDRFPTIERLLELLPSSTAEPIPVPSDCTDRFLAALWARPQELLDPAIRAATSPWYDLPADTVERALERLGRDLDTGIWHKRHGHLLDRSELDVGLRLVTSTVTE